MIGSHVCVPFKRLKRRDVHTHTFHNLWTMVSILSCSRRFMPPACHYVWVQGSHSRNSHQSNRWNARFKDIALAWSLPGNTNFPVLHTSQYVFRVSGVVGWVEVIYFYTHTYLICNFWPFCVSSVHFRCTYRRCIQFSVSTTVPWVAFATLNVWRIVKVIQRFPESNSNYAVHVYT